MRPGEETTIEEWEERFRKDVQRRPGWSVLPIEMLFSQAYRSLSGSAQLALQFALSQVLVGEDQETRQAEKTEE